MQVYDLNGKAENINLDFGLEKKEVSPLAYSCAIQVLRQNWRQGTVACKDRGEVAFSTKKPWKQKGTGRARAGMKSSPLWRKGGVVFGPQERVRTLKIHKKMRSAILNNIFHVMNEKENISCLDFTPEKPTTKVAFNALTAIGLSGKKLNLFLNPSDWTSMLCFQNIPNVNILLFDEPNVYALTNCEHWLFLKKDMASFKDMVSKWN